VTGALFSPGTPVFSTNKTDHHDITIVESGIKHYNPNQELPFYPMYSLINCLESSFQIAGMVKTQWRSISYKSYFPYEEENGSHSR
jgi:hypothetical protein